MFYLHDLWVNWVENATSSLEVYDFHEWNKDDSVLLLDQIPMVRVTKEFMDIVENNNVTLPDTLLESVHQMSYASAGRGRKRLEYAVVLSDGERVLAIDTEGTDKTVLKSRLIPRQHNLAIEMISSASVKKYNLPEIIEEGFSLEFSGLVGLTRREKEMKKLVSKGLLEVKETGNVNELRYYLSELDPVNYKSIKKLDIDTCYEELTNLFNNGWSKEHEELARVFLKANSKYSIVYNTIFNSSKDVESEKV